MAGLETYVCARCGRSFEWPWLSDMSYGQAILHGERGTVHREVCVLDHPVWCAIDTVLREDEPAGSDRWWRVLAALADPVEGQRLQMEEVCPHCQADFSHFKFPPQASTVTRVAALDEATFSAFLALPPAAQRQRIEAEAQKQSR